MKIDRSAVKSSAVRERSALFWCAVRTEKDRTAHRTAALRVSKSKVTMFRELFIAPIHMRTALRRCEHEGTPLRMRKRIEKPGDRRAVTRPSRPRAPRADPPSPRGFDFGFAHAASTPPDGPRSSSCAAGTRRSTRNTKTLRRLRPDFSACPTQMQIRCPRVPGMRFGFMLNKRSQRNYRGTVLLRSH